MMASSYNGPDGSVNMQAYRFLSSNWLTVATAHSGKKTTPLSLDHNYSTCAVRTAPREILCISRSLYILLLLLLLSSNDDIQPSTVVTNQSPSGIVFCS